MAIQRRKKREVQVIPCPRGIYATDIVNYFPSGEEEAGEVKEVQEEAPETKEGQEKKEVDVEDKDFWQEVQNTIIQKIKAEQKAKDLAQDAKVWKDTAKEYAECLFLLIKGKCAQKIIDPEADPLIALAEKEEEEEELSDEEQKEFRYLINE